MDIIIIISYDRYRHFKYISHIGEEPHSKQTTKNKAQPVVNIKPFTVKRIRDDTKRQLQKIGNFYFPFYFIHISIANIYRSTSPIRIYISTVCE